MFQRHSRFSLNDTSNEIIRKPWIRNPAKDWGLTFEAVRPSKPGCAPFFGLSFQLKTLPIRSSWCRKKGCCAPPWHAKDLVSLAALHFHACNQKFPAKTKALDCTVELHAYNPRKHFKLFYEPQDSRHISSGPGRSQQTADELQRFLPAGFRRQPKKSFHVIYPPKSQRYLLVPTCAFSGRLELPSQFQNDPPWEHLAGHDGNWAPTLATQDAGHLGAHCNFVDICRPAPFRRARHASSEASLWCCGRCGRTHAESTDRRHAAQQVPSLQEMAAAKPSALAETGRNKIMTATSAELLRHLI